MKVAELFASIGLDVNASSFLKGQLAVDAVRSGLRMLGNAARDVFRTFLDVGSVIATADKIDELSQSAGISTDALQELAHAGSFSGMSIDSMALSLGKLSRIMASARDGSKESADAFKKIGVSVTDGKGNLRAADAVLMDIAESFKVMPDGAEKTALAMKLFGRGGAQMIPFLNAGKSGLAGMREEAQRLGIVLDETTIKQGAAADDAMTSYRAALTGVRNTIVSALIPAITEAAKRATAWVGSNKPLIKSIGGALVTAMKVLWKVLSGVGSVLGFLIRQWKLLAIAGAAYVAAVLLPQIPVLWAVALGYAKLGLAAAVAGMQAAGAWLLAAAPVLAVAALFALVALAIEDVYQWMNGGSSVIGDWLGDWDEAANAIEMMFHDALDWIADKIEALGRAAKKVADMLSGEYGEESRAKSAEERAAAHAAALGRAPVTDAEVFARALGDPSVSAMVRAPMVSSQGGASSSSSSKSVTVAPGAISITQLPGESQDALANRVMEKVKTFWDDKLEAAVP